MLLSYSRALPSRREQLGPLVGTSGTDDGCTLRLQRHDDKPLRDLSAHVGPLDNVLGAAGAAEVLVRRQSGWTELSS